ncbi:MAG: HAD-IA family hydrolase [Candidatus Diapherotrites archaeon]
MFRLVIFDLDGTLADTKEGIAKTFNKVLAERGIPAVPAERIYNTVGLSVEELFDELVESGRRGRAEMVNRYLEIYKEDALGKGRLFPGAKEALFALKRAGLTLAIATGKRHESAELMLEKLGIRKLFAAVVAVDDVENGKPAPDIAERVLELTGMRKEDALIVGDTVHDIEMGKSAGIKTCAVTYGVHSRAALEKAEPDFMADKAGEIITIAGCGK